MTKKDNGYNFRMPPQKHWEFKYICQADRSNMQRELSRMVDEFIEERKQAGIEIPDCPYPTEDIPFNDLGELIDHFQDELIEAGFPKAKLAKFKSGKLQPIEQEIKGISKASGLSLESIKSLI